MSPHAAPEPPEGATMLHTPVLPVCRPTLHSGQARGRHGGADKEAKNKVRPMPFHLLSIVVDDVVVRGSSLRSLVFHSLVVAVQFRALLVSASSSHLESLEAPRTRKACHHHALLLPTCLAPAPASHPRRSEPRPSEPRLLLPCAAVHGGVPAASRWLRHSDATRSLRAPPFSLLRLLKALLESDARS